jgi:hypothetical protein
MSPTSVLNIKGSGAGQVCMQVNFTTRCASICSAIRYRNGEAQEPASVWYRAEDSIFNVYSAAATIPL